MSLAHLSHLRPVLLTPACTLLLRRRLCASDGLRVGLGRTGQLGNAILGSAMLGLNGSQLLGEMLRCRRQGSRACRRQTELWSAKMTRLESARRMYALRFDEIVLRPVDVLQRVASFLALPAFPKNFKVEYGRENYTTIARLLKTGAVTKANLQTLEAFFAPHDATLRQMFGGQSFW